MQFYTSFWHSTFISCERVASEVPKLLFYLRLVRADSGGAAGDASETFTTTGWEMSLGDAGDENDKKKGRRTSWDPWTMGTVMSKKNFRFTSIHGCYFPTAGMMDLKRKERDTVWEHLRFTAWEMTRKDKKCLCIQVREETFHKTTSTYQPGCTVLPDLFPWLKFSQLALSKL